MSTSRILFGSLLLVLTGWAWTACGDDSPPSGAPSDETTLGETGDETSETETTEVTISEVEPSTSPTGDEPSRTIPEPEIVDGVVICTESAQCDSGLCVRFDTNAAEGLCADFCVTDEECQEGFACVPVRPGRDTETACVPTDFCLDRDGDGYGIGPGCDGTDCDDNNPDVYPGAPEFCNGIDNNCNGVADSNPVDVNLDCDTGLPGICAEGRTVCENGDLVCRPVRQPAEFETCNGQDMTCDGVVDGILGADNEPIVLERPCYEGPSGSQGVGACRAGVRRCEDGAFGACIGQVLPGDFEVCDGQDTNCDGLVDNNPIDVGGLCDTGLPGICGEGVLICDEGEIVCRAINQEAPVETCNGRDDTCDGLVDQIFNDQGEPEALRESCYTGPSQTRGRGICEDGWRTCEDGEWGDCVGEVLPREEVCNGLDDNCDGLVDNADSSGTLLSETCYSADPDTIGVGECREGTRFCINGELGPCVGEVTPQPETCDGRDNSCNGHVDQSVPGVVLQRPCYDGPEVTLGEGECRGGTQTCGSGEWGRCDGQVLPSVEVCNGLDNSCDGTVDSGNPGGGIPCNSGEPGICAAGTTQCNSDTGGIDCVPNILPGTQTEVCNGLDMNCDGTVDSGFDDLGTPCTVSTGACQRTGVRVCNPDDESASPVCNATPGTPNPETCNFQDDSCDGIIDTPFRNTQGVYFQVQHCGACGINCNNFWPGGPENFGVTPICSVSGSLATCEYECLPGFVDADGVAENGCELQPDAGAIYVARPISGGADSGSCGTWDAPCASINHGITRAATVNAQRLRVADGNYRETVTMANGISLLGGHSAVNWQRNPDVFVSVITGQVDPSRPDQWAVLAQGINAATELSGFTLQAPNGRSGAAGSPAGNSIGLYLVNTTNALVVENNNINAGDGGTGARGASGGSGLAGVNGSAGNPGINNSTQNCPSSVSGGAGGARSCGASSVSGGNGAGAVCFNQSPNSYTGVGAPTIPRNPPPGGGSGTNGGAAGISGHHRVGIFFDGLDPRTAVVTFSSPTQGSSGLAGGAGSDGAGGSGASNANGSISSNQWRGQAGTDGVAATNGSGGGGGGSAGSIQACMGRDNFGYYGCPERQYVSPSGGGGGSGGCAGVRGLGGSAGGGSFAIFVRNTGGAVGNLPQIRDNVLTRAQGGAGGDGGNGGAGGEGGDGGSGGTADTSIGSHAFAMLSGADGGTGGRGGHGGGGGGGAGGLSYDILLSGAGAASPNWTSVNTFIIPAGTNTAGPGGDGGNSSNTVTGLGANGVAGTSGILLSL